MSEVSDVAQAISSSANLGEKLVNVIEKATCGLLKPRQMIRKAKAAAKVIDIMSEAYKKHPEIEFNYKSEELDISTELQDLTSRAANRLAITEVKKELNIENVIQISFDDLKNYPNIDNSEPDKDWVLKFFNSVENISNEKMQKLWANILSGEIKRPNSFSLRTLNILTNLSQEDCEFIENVAQYTFRANECIAIYRDMDILEKYGINFKKFKYLQELNIIDSSLFTDMTIHTSDKDFCVLRNDDYVLISHKQQNIDMPIYTFTTSGEQILSLFNYSLNTNYLLDVFQNMHVTYKDLTYHKIKTINNKNIQYDLRNLFS